MSLDLGETTMHNKSTDLSISLWFAIKTTPLYNEVTNDSGLFSKTFNDIVDGFFQGFRNDLLIKYTGVFFSTWLQIKAMLQ